MSSVPNKYFFLENIDIFFFVCSSAFCFETRKLLIACTWKKKTQQIRRKKNEKKGDLQSNLFVCCFSPQIATLCENIRLFFLDKVALGKNFSGDS